MRITMFTANPRVRAVRSRTPGVAVFALLGAALVTVLGCGSAVPGAGQKKEVKPVLVALAPATTSPVQRGIDVVGTLWADEDATIATKAGGKVAAVYKDIGDRVRSGEPVLQIVPTDYVLAKREKELAVEESLGKLGLTTMPAGNFDAANVPTVRRAKLQAENAAARFARGKKLFEQQPPRISEQDYEDLKTAWEVAQSNHDVELLTAKSTLNEAKTRKAELDIASQRLTDTTVRAPAADSGSRAEAMMGGIAGAEQQEAKAREYFVAAKLISVGEFSREGNAVFRLVDDSTVKLRAAVPERYAIDVRNGREAKVTIEASPDVFAGRVTRINPQVDPANRTFDVEITIPNEKRLLKPGAFAKARILTRLDPAVVFVPQEAIVSFAGVNKVFTIDTQKRAQEVIVTLGDRGDAGVEVKNGLTGKESVVVAGNSKLATGVKVEVKSESASMKPADTSASAPATQPTASADTEARR